MTAEEKIYAILSAAAGVTALVPAARIKPPGDWQVLDLPYIVHFPVGIEPIHEQVEGLAALRIWRYYQISIFAGTHGQARTIGSAVLAALDGYDDSDVDRIALTNIVVMEYDTERQVAHLVLDFEVAGALA